MPRWALTLIFVVLAGVALAALGRLSDTAPIPIRAAFNLGVPWLLAAMVAGAAVGQTRLGAAGGALLLATAMTAYYGILLVVEGRGGGGYAVTMAVWWGAIGAMGGAVFGLAGALARRWCGPGLVVAAALAGGALGGEGLWLLASRAYVLAPAVVVFEVLLGALLPLTLARRPAHLAAGLALTAAFTLVGVVAAETTRELVWAQGWRGR